MFAALSSAMYGLGYTSPFVRAFRLLFHFLSYTLGAIATAHWLYRRANANRVRVAEA